MQPQETRKENQLEKKLCPYSGICDYSGREICSGNYEKCKNYRIFKRKTKKLPDGTAWGLGWIENIFRKWPYLGGGISKDEKRKQKMTGFK